MKSARTEELCPFSSYAVFGPQGETIAADQVEAGKGHVEYHFLRELKQAGLNLVMLDFETLAQEFVTDEGLKKWTDKVAAWADHAQRYKIRLMPAIDLGGTQYEVDAWGDSPKGLYVEDASDRGHSRAGAPLAPCPLSVRA